MRRAVVGSVAVHVVAFLAVFAIVRFGDKPETTKPPGIDTRADTVLRITSIEVTIPTADEEPATPKEAAQNTRPPTVTAMPNPLPTELVALIRSTSISAKPQANSVQADPNVRPAAAIASPPVQPLHGAMADKQSVVYVLDCSGSMGEFGKLDAARAALIATLRLQSGEVRFQVIAYNSTARTLLSGGWLPATAANVSAAEVAFASVKAAGRSNHKGAIAAAAMLRPDYIVLLTDAADAELAVAGKRPPLHVATVTANGVDPPRKLR